MCYSQVMYGLHRKGLPNNYRMDGLLFLAEKVRKRDNYTCQKCGKKWVEGTRQFDVHHLEPENESKRTYENYKRINMMLTLCHKCHLNLPHIKAKMRGYPHSLTSQ